MVTTTRCSGASLWVWSALDCPSAGGSTNWKIACSVSSCWARYARINMLDADVQQFIAANTGFLAKAGNPMEMLAEPTERGWEMVSRLRDTCRFPKDLEMEVYAGVVGKEAAISFLRWCADNRQRPVAALDVLDNWSAVAERVKTQRADLQAVTMNELVSLLQEGLSLQLPREENLLFYIDSLPRDLRFGVVKSLLKIPEVATILVQDRYDSVVLDAISAISSEA